MAVKTFVPQILRIADRFCNYITKHHSTLNSFLSPTQVALMNAAVSACQAFSTSVTVPREEP